MMNRRKRYTRRYGQPGRVETSIMKRLSEHLKQNALPVRYGPVFVGYWYMPFHVKAINPFMSVAHVTSLRCIKSDMRVDINSVYGNMYTYFTPDMMVDESTDQQYAFFDTSVRMTLHNLNLKYGRTVPYISDHLDNLNVVLASIKPGLLKDHLNVCIIEYNDLNNTGCVPLTSLIRHKIPKAIRMMGVMALPRSYTTKEGLKNVRYIERKMLNGAKAPAIPAPPVQQIVATPEPPPTEPGSTIFYT